MDRHTPLTPTQLRIRAEERRASTNLPEPRLLPRLAADGVLQSCAAGDWLAHVAAGRIAVR